MTAAVGKRQVFPSKTQGKRQSSSLFLILEKICKKVKGILKEIAIFFTVLMSLMLIVTGAGISVPKKYSCN